MNILGRHIGMVVFQVKNLIYQLVFYDDLNCNPVELMETEMVLYQMNVLLIQPYMALN